MRNPPKESNTKFIDKPPLNPARLYFPVAGWLHPSKIYPSRRLGENRSRSRERGSEISLSPLSLFLSVSSFFRSSPLSAISKRDHRTLIADCFNRLYPSRVHLSVAPFPRVLPWFDCCLAEIRASGIFSGSARKAGRRDFHTYRAFDTVFQGGVY